MIHTCIYIYIYVRIHIHYINTHHCGAKDLRSYNNIQTSYAPLETYRKAVKLLCL